MLWQVDRSAVGPFGFVLADFGPYRALDPGLGASAADVCSVAKSFSAQENPITTEV